MPMHQRNDRDRLVAGPVAAYDERLVVRVVAVRIPPRVWEHSRRNWRRPGVPPPKPVPRLAGDRVERSALGTQGRDHRVVDGGEAQDGPGTGGAPPYGGSGLPRARK